MLICRSEIRVVPNHDAYSAAAAQSSIRARSWTPQIIRRIRIHTLEPVEPHVRLGLATGQFAEPLVHAVLRPHFERIIASSSTALTKSLFGWPGRGRKDQRP